MDLCAYICLHALWTVLNRGHGSAGHVARSNSSSPPTFDNDLCPVGFETIRETYELVSQLSDIYPTCVVEYISLSRAVRLVEEGLKMFPLAITRRQQVGFRDGNIDAWRKMLEGCIDKLRTSSRAVRSESYPLHDLDGVLKHSGGCHCDSDKREFYAKTRNHSDMFEIRKRTLDAGLLGNWTDTRDRVNRWLLRSLRSDDSLAQLHRSMLAEQDLDEKNWAREVIKYWTLDEAALGIDLITSLSVGAVDGREGSSLDSDEFYSCASRGPISSCNKMA